SQAGGAGDPHRPAIPGPAGPGDVGDRRPRGVRGAGRPGGAPKGPADRPAGEGPARYRREAPRPARGRPPLRARGEKRMAPSPPALAVRRLHAGERDLARRLFAVLAAAFGEEAEPLWGRARSLS